MRLTTLNSITEDLLRIIRGSQVATSEPISKRQLENWVHQYRAEIIKRELDKKRYISHEYVQEMTVPVAEESAGLYKSTIALPDVVFRNYEDGFTYIGTSDMEYQYVNPMRAGWQSHRKYSSAGPWVYLKEDHLYTNKDAVVTVRAIFENPIEAITDGDTETKYPIPANMLPTLKKMILNGELGIEDNSPSDDKNDSRHEVTSNAR